MNKPIDNEKQIDPRLIPGFTLRNGYKIPCIGLGTFGSDSVPHEIVAETVRKAIYCGYRHIDCASVYDNEKKIGNVLYELFKSGFIDRKICGLLQRSGMICTTRLAESCRQSLADLQIDYLDLYLVHWPFPKLSSAQMRCFFTKSECKAIYS